MKVEDVLRVMSSVRTLEDCKRAWALQAEWLRDHPEDEVVIDEGEALFMHEQALQNIAAQQQPLDKPILLLQWLEPGEERETREALNDFAQRIDVAFCDVQKSADARRAVTDWLKGNPNAQYLFIGAHGVSSQDNTECIGIGATYESDKYVTWEKLWKWLDVSRKPIAVWLGACNSSDAAKAWPPTDATKVNVEYLMSFGEKVYSSDIGIVLNQLLKNSASSRSVDQELHTLRQLTSKKVEMYYIANTDQARRRGKQWEYVNVEDIPRRLNKSFKQHLEDYSRR